MTTDFIEELKRTLNDKTDAGSRNHLKVTFRDLMKNNDTIRHACTVSLRNYKGMYAAPTLYLEDFYDYYLSGMSMARLADKILDYAEQFLRKPIVPSVDLSDYESIRTHLCVQLVNRERNGELLNQLVYSPLEDLAVIPVLLVKDPNMGQGCIKIRREHTESWGISDEQILTDSLANSPSILPAAFCPLEEMLEELSRSSISGEAPAVPEDEFYCGSVQDFESTPAADRRNNPYTMYLLSNSQLISGASSVVYPGVTEKIRRRIGSDYYLLPSSVNEWIVVGDLGQDPGEFKRIVQEVNRSEVPPDEVLSDSVYCYREGYQAIRRVC